MNMKKITSVLIVLLALALAACGADAPTQTSPPATANTPAVSNTPNTSDSTNMPSIEPTLPGEQDGSSYGEYRVGIDTGGFETLTEGSEYLLDDLYVSMHAYPSSGESYDEESMSARLEQLEDVSRVITVTESEEHSLLLTYPAWMLVYETGSNEDTRHCTDIYFQTDSGEYRVHTSVPVDMRTDYHDEVGKRLATISLEYDGAAGGTPDSGMPAATDEPTDGPENKNTIDSEEAAMELMTQTVCLDEGVALTMTGEGEVEGNQCWMFALGKNDEDKFTAEQHYAVTRDGRVFVLDILTNEYQQLR